MRSPDDTPWSRAMRRGDSRSTAKRQETHAPLADELRVPFAAAAVEDGERIALPEPQHAREMVRGRIVERDLARLLQRGVEVDPGLHANRRCSPRQIRRSRRIAPTINTARRTKNRIGWTNASHRPAGTMASSASEAAQLLNGSGRELIRWRRRAF